MYRNVRDKFKKLDKQGLQDLVKKHEHSLDDDAVSLVFFGNETFREIHDVFKQVASLEVDREFYIVEKEGLEKDYGLKFPGFMLLKSSSNPVVKYEGKLLHLNQIQKFIVQNSIKNSFLLGPEDNTPIFTHEIPYLILFIDQKDPKYKEVKEDFMKYGDVLGSKVKFALADFTDPFHDSIAEACGIFQKTEETLPQIFIFHAKGISYDRYVVKS